MFEVPGSSKEEQKIHLNKEEIPKSLNEAI